MKFKRNVLLKNYTTFRIGGPAKYFFAAKNKEDLIKAIKVARKINPSPFPKGDRVKLPFFILGEGSNLLISDKGFNGLIIKAQNTKYKILNTKIVAEAGTRLAELVNVSAKFGLTGLEWAAGIPGTVGGAIRGNAGAFRSSMANIIKTVEVLEAPSSKMQNAKIKMQNDNAKFKIKEYKNRDCRFGYRDSIFKKNKNLIILSAKLQLKKGRHPPATQKKEIKNKIQENLNYRKERQPLSFPSAGSVFKNYELRLQSVYYPPEKSGPIMNYKLVKEFPELREFNKNNLIPAGYLVEKCGLKGKRVGQVQISEKHANFIVNLGGGKAEDVKKLIKLIKNKVKKKFGVTLEEEIQFLGF